MSPVGVILLILGVLPFSSHGASQEGEKWPNPIPGDVGGSVKDLETLFRQGKWADATVTLKTRTQENPRSLEDHFLLARALVHLNRREEALRVLVSLEQRVDDLSRTRIRNRIKVLGSIFRTNELYQAYQEGVNLLESGKWSEALAQFTEVEKEEPYHLHVLLRKGQAFLLKGQVDDALVTFKKASDFSQAEPRIELWHGRALALKGHYDEALPLLELARNRLPHLEQGLLWYSEALFKSGGSRAALRHLQRNLQKNPFHLRALLQLAKFKFSLKPLSQKDYGSVKRLLRVGISRVQDAPSGTLKHPLDLPGPLNGDSNERIKSELHDLLAQVEGEGKTSSLR